MFLRALCLWAATSSFVETFNDDPTPILPDVLHANTHSIDKQISGHAHIELCIKMGNNIAYHMKCEMRFGVTRSWVNCGSVEKEDIVTIRSISFAISRCVLSSPNFKWDTTSILQNAQLGGYANMLSGSALWWQCRPLSITVHTFQPTTSSNRWTYNDPVAINCTHRRWPRFLSFAFPHQQQRLAAMPTHILHFFWVHCQLALLSLFYRW